MTNMIYHQVEFDSRVLARKEGRRYVDPLALNYQSSQMPDPIRLKVGAVPPQQAAVYDEFARIIPGFKVGTIYITESIYDFICIHLH